MKIHTFGIVLLGLSAAGVASAADWGTVKGQVVWAGGAVPAPATIQVNKDAGTTVELLLPLRSHQRSSPGAA